MWCEVNFLDFTMANSGRILLVKNVYAEENFASIVKEMLYLNFYYLHFVFSKKNYLKMQKIPRVESNLNCLPFNWNPETFLWILVGSFGIEQLLIPVHLGSWKVDI